MLITIIKNHKCLFILKPTFCEHYRLELQEKYNNSKRRLHDFAHVNVDFPELFSFFCNENLLEADMSPVS